MDNNDHNEKNGNDDEQIQEESLKLKSLLQGHLEELEFLRFLTEAPIYRSGILNLFENLEYFKNQINKLETINSGLLTDLDSQIEEMEQASSYRTETIISKRVELNDKIRELKSHFYPYIKSVVKD